MRWMTFYVSSSSPCPQQFFIDGNFQLQHNNKRRDLNRFREEDDKEKKGQASILFCHSY
ncbi:hypothetical protein T09_9420 [Trichinella sp. T9]|nr:hypothetical protein T09_9420 [Trichinella sp. T9]